MKKTPLLALIALVLLGGCTTNASDNQPHRLGNAEADVLVEIFSDPECPACAVISLDAEQLIRENPNLARLQYYHFPLSYHEYAFIAAEASECAGVQGKFFDYLDMIYANQSSLSEDYLYNVADTLKLDRTAFDTCLENHTFKGKIQSHMAEGSRRQIPGTPTFFVNGQMIQWSGAEIFKAYLESL